jgi:GNAT superfamily N-acetyltransferase
VTEEHALTWRPAGSGDVAAVVALLVDDVLGAGREGQDLAPYRAALAQMEATPHNRQIVGCRGAAVIATYQIVFLDGLSLGAARRAQIEGVRVAKGLRGQGIGTALMADAEARARAAGCRLIQFTTHASRTRAQAFYAGCGYTPSHIGFKKPLA